MIKDVLVHVDGTRSGQRRLNFALALVKEHSAHLTAAHVVPPPDAPTVFKPSMIESATEAQEERGASDADHARRYFDQLPASEVLAAWLDLSGDLAPELAKAARYADLVIVGQYERQTPVERHPLSLAESLVLECGRPVLVIPGHVDMPHIRRVLIAWDGSVEAVRAIHDALPLLRQSLPVVEIATIQEDGNASLQPLLGHLQHHGIEVVGGPQLPERDTAAEALSTRLKDGRFDLLVMGAYSRPAWLELLFGGTTPAALMQATVPILISH